MKRYFLLGLFFLLTTLFCHLQAEGYKVEDIPPMPEADDLPF